MDIQFVYELNVRQSVMPEMIQRMTPIALQSVNAIEPMNDQNQ